MVYFLYRLVLVVLFALGFLFELVFDREYHGGSRTAMRGLFVTTCALGAFCGTLARNAWLSYSQAPPRRRDSFREEEKMMRPRVVIQR